jgi:hypothetical protein
MMHTTLVSPSLKEVSVSPVPLIPEPPLTPAGEPSNYPAVADDVDKSSSQSVTAADQPGKPALMADIIKLPETSYLKAKNLPGDQRLKLAGQLAAEVLKRYPHLIQHHLIQHLDSMKDPVPAWTIERTGVYQLGSNL